MSHLNCPAVRLVLARGALVACALNTRCYVNRLEAGFALWRQEVRFARALLDVQTRFWLFRVHQHSGSGDFIALDRSGSARRPARVWAIELKQSVMLRLWRCGLQLAHFERVTRWISEHYALELLPAVPVVGNHAHVLGLLSGAPSQQ